MFYGLALICGLDYLCFRQTTYHNINSPGKTIYVIILDPAGPLMYPDQITYYSISECQVAIMKVKNFPI